MNTKVCKHCKQFIPKKAKRCPVCRGKLGLPSGVKVLIIIFIIFACLVGCVNSCSKEMDKAIEDNKNSYKDVNGKTSFKVNELFQNKYEKITMTAVNTNFKDYSKYLKPSNGNKVIALKFEIENINEDDTLYVSSLDFNAYADGTAVKSFYTGNDNYKDFSATLGKGKKTIGFVFYEVPTNAKKIIVEYKADYWNDGTTVEFEVQ